MSKFSRDFALASALAIIASGPTFAAEKSTPLPKDLPPYGPTKAAAAPAVVQYKLPNGLTVWLIPSPGFPKVALTVAVRGGYAADPGDRPGMADLLAATLSQGTKTRSAKQFAEELQAAGGDLSAEATSDAIIINTGVLSSSGGTAVNLLSDLMRNAAFADGEVAIAKRNAASGLEANEADPQFLATRALYRALFGAHPYSVTTPTQASIAETSAADLRKQYLNCFRPDQSVLVIAGGFDEKQIAAAIVSAFGSWKVPEFAPISAAPVPDVAARGIGVLVPRADSVQTALYLGALGPTRSQSDYAATRVANAIYGGMFGSRLVSNIREDKGYSYSPDARIVPKRRAAVIGTRADVRNAVTGAAFNEINYELNRMASTAPQEAELERAKRYLVGSLAIQSQSRSAISRSLANLWVDGLAPEEFWTQTLKLEAVSDKDVQSAARKYFSAWKMTVVAVGEEKVVKEELAPFKLDLRQMP